MTTPALSLILCSRNDDYMGNSRWRLQTTLNYVAERVHELGREDDVEVLVADWGSQVPLREVLELSAAAVRLVSFILIPPELARELQKDSPFPEVLALNAAARRAEGEYIGRIDQDTLVGERFLRYFFGLYEGRQQLDVPLSSALLFANRRSIPYRFAVRCLPLGQVDRFIRVFGPLLKVWKQNPFGQDLFWTSYVGIWLLHRDIWNACGGYDERLIYYNWMETDMILRLAKSYQVADLGKMVDYDFYHLEHYNPRTAWSARAHAVKNPDLDTTRSLDVLKPNGENWGLIQFTLPALRGTLSRSGVDAKDIKSHGDLPAFIFIVLGATTETLYDRLVLSLVKATFVWRHRTLVAWKTIRQEPIVMWPRLLIRLWIERKSAQEAGEQSG